MVAPSSARKRSNLTQYLMHMAVTSIASLSGDCPCHPSAARDPGLALPPNHQPFTRRQPLGDRSPVGRLRPRLPPPKPVVYTLRVERE